MIDGVTGLIGGTVAMGLAVISLDGAKVSIELAAGVLVSTGSIIWWLSSKFRGLDDNQARTNERLDGVAERLGRIEQALRNCPMNKGADCEAED